MEGDLHGPCGSDKSADGGYVDLAVGSEDAEDDAVGTESCALRDLGVHLIEFGLGTDEVAWARTDHCEDGDGDFVSHGAEEIGGWGEAADFERRAEFDAVGTAGSSGAGGCD
jgi:hypothetical protein